MPKGIRSHAEILRKRTTGDSIEEEGCFGTAFDFDEAHKIWSQFSDEDVRRILCRLRPEIDLLIGAMQNAIAKEDLTELRDFRTFIRECDRARKRAASHDPLSTRASARGRRHFHRMS